MTDNPKKRCFQCNHELDGEVQPPKPPPPSQLTTMCPAMRFFTQPYDKWHHPSKDVTDPSFQLTDIVKSIVDNTKSLAEVGEVIEKLKSSRQEACDKLKSFLADYTSLTSL